MGRPLPPVVWRPSLATTMESLTTGLASSVGGAGPGVPEESGGPDVSGSAAPVIVRLNRVDLVPRIPPPPTPRLAGGGPPIREHARQCLGVPVDLEPVERFEAAHARLDAALPPGPGSLSERLHSWNQAHAIPPERLPELARLAIDETVTRTRAIVSLPDEVHVDVQMTPGAHRGQFTGGARGIMHLSDGTPFNGADLLYVVAHEGFPGHIAESMLKSIHLADHPEHRIRFMISPPFVVSEGIGLHAPGVAFPDDEGQRWLTEHVLAPLGIRPDGSDFAAVHDARNVLWGAVGNAAILAGEGRPDAEIADYLTSWALPSDAETAWMLQALRSPSLGV